MIEQEEIHEYNLRCAEFMKNMKYKKAHEYRKPFENLKYLYKVDTSIYDKPWTEELQQKISNTKIGEIFLGYCIDIRELKFHSDWNWIMEVCISIGMECVTSNKEQLIQQIYDKLRSMETNS